MTLPPYGSSPTLDDDVGDAGFVTEAGKFRVHRLLGSGSEGGAISGWRTDLQERNRALGDRRTNGGW